MGHIYRNLREIPRPKESRVSESDGRVYVMVESAGGKKRKVNIGAASGDKMMHPNDNFKELYPELWREYYSRSSAAILRYLKMGMYAASLHIGHKTGLYPLLASAFGLPCANAVMDFIDYSLLYRPDEPKTFSEAMKVEALYLPQIYPESSRLYLLRSITQDQISCFQKDWMKECRKRGMTRAWISMDCVGKVRADQEESSTLFYLCALNAEDGTPITYCVHKGDITDGRAIQEMVSSLQGEGIETEGIILGRKLGREDVFKEIIRLGYRYVMKLPEGSYAHESMLEKYVSRIRMRSEYYIGDALFAIRDETEIFEGCPEKSQAFLYFDLLNAKRLTIAGLKGFARVKEEMNRQLEKGWIPTIPPRMRRILHLEKDGDQIFLETDDDAWKNYIETRGFYTLAASEDVGIEEAARIDRLSNSPRKQLQVMDHLPGFGFSSLKSSQEIENRFAVWFAASIVRTELVRICKSLKLRLKPTVENLDFFELFFADNLRYSSTFKMTERSKRIFSGLDLTPENISILEELVYYHDADPQDDEFHTLPEKPQKSKRGRPAKRK